MIFRRKAWIRESSESTDIISRPYSDLKGTGQQL